MAMSHENGVNRCKEAFDSARDQAQQAYDETEHMVKENPLSAALTAFSVGIGVGMLVTYALMPTRKRSWQQYGEGNVRQFADTVAQMIPESLMKRFS